MSTDKDTFLHIFSERLALLIKPEGEQKITQKKIAENIGVEQPTVGRWIKGEAIPGGYQLFKLARFLGVSMEYFFAESQVPVAELKDEPTQCRDPRIILLQEEIAEIKSRCKAAETLLQQMQR